MTTMMGCRRPNLVAPAGQCSWRPTRVVVSDLAAAAALAIAVAWSIAIAMPCVSAHGYLKTPQSRNLLACEYFFRISSSLPYGASLSNDTDKRCMQ